MNVTINAKIKIAGHFTLIARNPKTGEKRLLADFDNLIVNQGLDYLGAKPGTNYQLVGGCIVGTGNTPPAATDTHVEDFLAGTNTQVGTLTHSVNLTTPPYYTRTVQTWEFAVGVAAGNISEICTCNLPTNSVPTSANPIFSRALVMNDGVPVTITVLPDEILDVLYQETITVPSVDIEGDFDLDVDGTPTTYSYVMKPAWVSYDGSLNNWFFASRGLNFPFDASVPFQGNACNAYQASTFAFNSALTGLPSGLNAKADSATVGSYVSGTFKNTFSFKFNIATANYASGIGGFYWGGHPTIWQMSVSPAIMKTSTQELTMNFQLEWSNG